MAVSWATRNTLLKFSGLPGWKTAYTERPPGQKGLSVNSVPSSLVCANCILPGFLEHSSQIGRSCKERLGRWCPFVNGGKPTCGHHAPALLSCIYPAQGRLFLQTCIRRLSNRRFWLVTSAGRARARAYPSVAHRLCGMGHGGIWLSSNPSPSSAPLLKPAPPLAIQDLHGPPWLVVVGHARASIARTSRPSLTQFAQS